MCKTWDREGGLWMLKLLKCQLSKNVCLCSDGPCPSTLLVVCYMKSSSSWLTPIKQGTPWIVYQPAELRRKKINPHFWKLSLKKIKPYTNKNTKQAACVPHALQLYDQIQLLSTHTCLLVLPELMGYLEPRRVPSGESSAVHIMKYCLQQYFIFL